MISLKALTFLDADDVTHGPINSNFINGVNFFDDKNCDGFDALSFKIQDISSGTYEIGDTVIEKGKNVDHVSLLCVNIKGVASIECVFLLDASIEKIRIAMNSLKTSLRILKTMPADSFLDKKTKLKAMLDVVKSEGVSYLLINMDTEINLLNAELIYDVISAYPLVTLIKKPSIKSLAKQEKVLEEENNSITVSSTGSLFDMPLVRLLKQKLVTTLLSFALSLMASFSLLLTFSMFANNKVGYGITLIICGCFLLALNFYMIGFNGEPLIRKQYEEKTLVLYLAYSSLLNTFPCVLSFLFLYLLSRNSNSLFPNGLNSGLYGVAALLLLLLSLVPYFSPMIARFSTICENFFHKLKESAKD